MIICGIDEAGRGPLAGPVVAAGVVFEKKTRIHYVKDSKKLCEEERELLFGKIKNRCLEFKISIIDHQTIDNVNILQATMLAFENIITGLTIKPDIYLIDGNYFKCASNLHQEINFKTIIDGDDKIFQISCASILAKVTRDRIMKNYHLLYPDYNFESHKGYATPEHIKNIKKFGLCSLHRRSFCSNLINSDELCREE
jgi:ribonuclease HII